MQAVWMAFDDLAGKGIDFIFILKFLWYTSLLVAPQALPIGILLSSIMTLGSLSEKYEFAAAKSAGISLQRIVRPLVFLALFISAINFLFLNYVYPYAMLKQLNLKVNIKKKQPSLALVPGSFNTEIPDFQIKFDEKYGEEENLLKNVLIYDLSDKKANNKIISAKTGELPNEEGSRYMTLILRDGHFFEHHIKKGESRQEKEKMPASYAKFDEYTINIDMSSFSDGDLDDLKYTRNYNMLSLKQLKDTLPTLKLNYDEYVKSRTKNVQTIIKGNLLYKYPDSISKEYDSLSLVLLDNFELKKQKSITKNALAKVDRSIKSVESKKSSFKRKRKILNKYDIEFYNRVAFSLASILLFFIGAPLGSIIRKGGMGLPMILAIGIYVLYFFSNTFGRNLAEESSVSAIIGSWIAFFIMLPIAITLTVRATQDKGLFDINSFFSKIVSFFKKLFSKQEKTIE